jgi:hypothetical protein
VVREQKKSRSDLILTKVLCDGLAFVSSYLQYSRKQINPSELKNDIIEKNKDRLEKKYLEQKADKYSVLFDGIVDFIKTTKR